MNRINDQKDIFVSVLPCKLGEKLECVNDETEGFDWIICVSVTLVVLVTVCVIVVVLRRRRSAVEMEKNEYYGREDEYYDEHDNRVEDRNDYYQ